MPFDSRAELPGIAIVGGGIAGLSAALVLGEHARVTLFEAEPRLGGHARTVVAGRHGDRAVDTGFIVFNHATYPHLGRLFRELDVPLERSDMSFGASRVRLTKSTRERSPAGTPAVGTAAAGTPAMGTAAMGGAPDTGMRGSWPA